MNRLGKGGAWWIAISFFLLSVAPGLWCPALANILKARDLVWVLPYAFAVGPLMSMVSPLIFGALADHRVSAQKLMGILSLLGAGFLGLAFVVLDRGWGAGWYLVFQTLNALISAPMWALLSTVALTNLQQAEVRFPIYRLWGTVGWICAGVMVSKLGWDSSPVTGMVAAGVRVLVGFACFMMPDTPPLGKVEGSGRPSWRKALGLDALGLFGERRMKVFLTTGTLFSVPLAAFYMYAPLLLSDLGADEPTRSMTWGQVTEIVSMLLLGWMMTRVKIRWLLIASIVFGFLRYGLFAYADWSGSLMWALVGVALHGPCYTFFFVTGQMLVNRRVSPDMRNQAQALFGTLTGGLGGFAGSLYCGLFFHGTEGLIHHWAFFWGWLAMAVMACGVYFVVARRS